MVSLEGGERRKRGKKLFSCFFFLFRPGGGKRNRRRRKEEKTFPYVKVHFFLSGKNIQVVTRNGSVFHSLGKEFYKNTSRCRQPKSQPTSGLSISEPLRGTEESDRLSRRESVFPFPFFYLYPGQSIKAAFTPLRGCIPPHSSPLSFFRYISIRLQPHPTSRVPKGRKASSSPPSSFIPDAAAIINRTEERGTLQQRWRYRRRRRKDGRGRKRRLRRRRRRG